MNLFVFKGTLQPSNLSKAVNLLIEQNLVENVSEECKKNMDLLETCEGIHLLQESGSEELR